MAAGALASSCAEIDQLRARVEQLEAISLLSAETIRGMQRAAVEIGSRR